MKTFLTITRSAYLSKKIWEEGEETIPFRELLILGVVKEGIQTKLDISKRLMRDKSSISREIDDLYNRGFLNKKDKKYYLTDISEETINRSEGQKNEILAEIFPETTAESREDFSRRLLKLEKGLHKYLTGSDE